MSLLPFQIPLDQWTTSLVDYMTKQYGGVFDHISSGLNAVIGGLQHILMMVPPIIAIPLVALLALWLGGWRLGLLAAIGLLLIDNLHLWDGAMQTLALVFSSELLVLLIGIPVGILAAKSDRVDRVLRPILDFMQTMPAFVYLIPAVMFFGLGMVPAVLSTFIFATPPLIRLTSLGIRQVPHEMVEAAQAFGGKPGQVLFKVELPAALPVLMTGLNQSIMLSLSMVVIAAMIGAAGLGKEVLEGVTQLNVGTGFTGGLGVVILAILLDRMTQKLNSTKKGAK